MDLKTIVRNITKPNDLNFLSLNLSKSDITHKKDKTEISLNYYVNGKINILSLIYWFKYKINWFNQFNKIKSLSLAYWDDDKEYDFIETYHLLIILSLKTCEYHFIKSNLTKLINSENTILMNSDVFIMNILGHLLTSDEKS